MKIYLNEHNGELIVTDNGTNLCESFKLLNANTTDAAQEKHVPVVKVSGDTVTVDVGSVPHPMTAEHLIACVILETNVGYQVRKLNHSDAPKAEFKLAAGEKPVAAYEYCNLHGLWVAKF